MRRKIKAILAVVLTAVMLAGGFSVSGTDAVKADVSSESALPFRELSGEDMIKEMGAGWNLGNTMDGHTGFTPNETVWQNVTTTKELIKSVHDMGFNTIRIPVTWGTMIDDDNDYAINEKWLSRVQDIVDYAIEQDMYVIVNIHHDGAEQMGWLRIATDDKEALFDKFGGVWKNISERFKDYDEHLIFEAMNEVRGDGMTLAEENEVIMELNQIFVDTIRETGSNNAKRWLVVCGKYNHIDSLVNSSGGFELPEDTVENRIILSVHCYTTWDFCGSESTSTTTYTGSALKNNNERELSALERFTSQGIPVIVGEYGCINKDNPEERAFFLEGMNRIFSKYNLVGIYWDQGWYDRSQTPDYSFTIIDRETGESIDKEVSDAILRGFFKPGDADVETLEHSPEVTPLEEINIEEESLELKMGETAELTVTEVPAENNDVVLYKTEDASVATVYNGMVRAKGIGETVITAFAQNGEAVTEINVKVDAADIDQCDDINLSTQEYEFEVGDYEYIEAGIDGGDDSAYLTYSSSDDSVATVSSIGKIVAVGKGSAVITVCCSDGISKDITVTVGDAESASEIRLALNVYYNDSTHEYYSNEVGSEIITVNEEGQYTLTFDCATDLSQAAKDAGVESLANLTAIYIKDQDVTEGNTAESPLETCDIMYDKIVVDGQEMTINQTEPKSALKSSGIFDTNDPINSWDGSSIDEVQCSGNVANFSTVENPTKIEVTFTLSNMKFKGADTETETVGETEPETEAETETETETETAADEQDSEDGNATWIIIGVAAAVVIVIIVVVIVTVKKKKNKA